MQISVLRTKANDQETTEAIFDGATALSYCRGLHLQKKVQVKAEDVQHHR